MANNYFISYDLIAPGKHYRRVQEAIESLGAWGKLELSFYYLNSSLDTEQVFKAIWAAMDANDVLVVVNSSTNQVQYQNILKEVADQMREFWNR